MLHYIEHDGFTEYTLGNASMEISGDWYYGQLTLCNKECRIMFYERDDEGNVKILAKNEQDVLYTFDDNEDDWARFASVMLTLAK